MNVDMKKNKSILLIVIGILLLLSVFIGTSYALWVLSYNQEGENLVSTDCFDITYTDSNSISLLDTYPMSDEEALELTPYTFTIKNICSHNADFNVNLETLSTSTLDANYLRVKLNNSNSKLLSEYNINDNKLVNNAINSRTLLNDVLFASEERTYNLRLYIDENSTSSQSTNKEYYGKVVVTASLNKNNNLIKLDSNGGEFSDGSLIKTIALNAEPVYDIEKYAHTDNINDEGIATGNYANNLNETKEVTI